MILEDLVILGQTEPQSSKKYGYTVCTAGYSRELKQFVRVYPLRWEKLRIRRWDLVEVPLVRNTQDSRKESWRLDESRQEILVKHSMKNHAEREKDFLLSMQKASIHALNDAKDSLGIVSPVSIEPYFAPRDSSIPQLDLFEKIHQESKWIPRLKAVFEDGTTNDLALRDWGSMEFLRKYPKDPDGLWDNLQFNNPNQHHFLFVGNHNQHRTTWLVISVFWVSASTLVFQDQPKSRKVKFHLNPSKQLSLFG